MTGNEETLKNTPEEKVSECSQYFMQHARAHAQKWHACLLFQCSVLSYYNFCQPGDEKLLLRQVKKKKRKKAWYIMKGLPACSCMLVEMSGVVWCTDDN